MGESTFLLSRRQYPDSKLTNTLETDNVPPTTAMVERWKSFFFFFFFFWNIWEILYKSRFKCHGNNSDAILSKTSWHSAEDLKYSGSLGQMGPYAVESRYLEVQGSLWNSSRYPYRDTSNLQNWGKNKIEQPHFTNEYVIWLLKLEIYWILEKRINCSWGANSPLFQNILLPVVRFPCKNKDQIFTSR